MEGWWANQFAKEVVPVATDQIAGVSQLKGRESAPRVRAIEPAVMHACSPLSWILMRSIGLTIRMAPVQAYRRQ